MCGLLLLAFVMLGCGGGDTQAPRVGLIETPETSESVKVGCMSAADLWDIIVEVDGDALGARGADLIIDMMNTDLDALNFTAELLALDLDNFVEEPNQANYDLMLGTVETYLETCDYNLQKVRR